MSETVTTACKECFPAHSNDCSAFVRAVAAKLGVTLRGNANDIVETIRTDPNWSVLADGAAAAREAGAGKLVVGGLKGSEQEHRDHHGHVVIVLPTPNGQPLADGRYPFAYWGRLGGGGREDTTVNWAWRAADLANVTYAAHDIAGA